MSRKRKGFNPVDYTFDNAMLSAGIMGSSYLVGSMPDTPMKGKVMKGMEPLGVLPTVHAAGGVFQMLGDLERKGKRRR